MRDLLTQPLWRPSDLGKPIPDSPHAVSVAMPTWDSVIGYEEEDPAVHRALQCGYPRFYCHPVVERLFDEAKRRHAGPGETALVFGSEAACRRCMAFMEAETESETGVARGEGVAARVLPWTGSPASILVFPEAHRRTALRYWRYSGEVVSSRQAEALLGHAPGPADDRGLRETLLERLASWSGREAAHGHLYASGMGAIFAAFRAVCHERPRGKTIQLEFPYVDVFCIQKSLGEGAHLLLGGDRAMEELKRLAEAETIRAVFCEIPSNPLLRTVDLPAVSQVCRGAGIPLIVDDTLGTVHNVDVYPHADLVTTSLTKSISGRGDVMAGSVWVCEESPWAARFQAFLQADEGAPLSAGDVEALLRNSEDFPARMERINAHGAALARYLAGRPEVERLYYPSRDTAEEYEKVRRPGGGHGGLLSFTLRGGEPAARVFYDALEVSKGPSLGTDYTLVCPYVLLAHYEELAWAESCGVVRHLIRVAVGLEPMEELEARFGRALKASEAVGSPSAHR